MMARAATSAELANLRKDNQRSILSLYIHKPLSVFTAMVSALPSSNDDVSEVGYTLVSGSAASVLDGMTCLIGTTAGGFDVGIIRAISASGGTLNIGVTSDIEWALGQYITVVEDWFIWARKLKYTDGLWNIEGELAYTDQNDNCMPVPVLGPVLAVKPYNGSPVTFSPNASASWVPASTISGYSWIAPGASSTSGMTTATPTITYNAPGVFTVSCTVTAANGETAIGHRFVYVPGTGYQPATNFTVENLVGEYSSGGWQFTITLYDTTEISGIRDKALVGLYARDFFGSSEVSIGPVTGYENVIAIGWIEGETIKWNPEQGSVKFTVKGPADWLQKTPSWPVALLDTETTPEDWMHIEGLTVDKGLWHLMSWRSTVTKIIDVYPSNDTRRAFDCSGNLGDIWSQLKAFTVKIAADPACDRYGRLFCRIDPQIIPVADRSTIPTVMAVSKVDWQDTLELQRREFRTLALIEVAGFNYSSGIWGALIARAPGNNLSHTGNMTSRYNLIFEDQTNANEIAELLFAKENNQYPAIPIQLGSNNRLIDICPEQYLTLTIAATDTPFGVVWTNQPVIPRRIEIAWDKDSGMLVTSVECEKVTVPISPSVMVTRPTTVTTTDFGSIADDVSLEPIGLGINFGDTTTEPVLDGSLSCPTGSANGPYDTWLRGTLYSSDPHTAVANMPGYARAGSLTNKTRYTLIGSFWMRDGSWAWVEDTLDNWYTIYLLDSGGNRIATGTKDALSNPRARTGYFNIPAGLDFEYVELALNSETLGTISSVVYGGSTPTIISSSVTWDYFRGGIRIVATSQMQGKWDQFKSYMVVTPSSGSFLNKHFHAYQKLLYAIHDQPGGSLGPPPVYPYWCGWDIGHGLDDSHWHSEDSAGDPSGDYLEAAKILHLVDETDFSYTEPWGPETGVYTNAMLRASPYPGDPLITVDQSLAWWLLPDPSYRIDLSALQFWNICAHS